MSKPAPSLLLALETTCDETAAALIDADGRVLSSIVATQEKLHERFGGVVPEIASRAHLERILPVIDEALQRAGVGLKDLGAVAVANTPGLAGSLLVGVAAAKALALALEIPIVGVNHLHGHLYACRVAAGRDVFPCVGLIASGGHTSLFECRTALDFQLLGGTIDDAAGEAFDKVGSLLGLPFPGGPAIEKAAAKGDPKAFDFPRSFLRDPERLEFSFSGLKTAVRYAIAAPETPWPEEPLEEQLVCDLAASFQAAVVDVLVGKSRQALERTRAERLCVGGGVAANGAFRAALEAMTAKLDVELHIAPRELCTDNAVLGAIAWERLRAGDVDDLSLDAIPGLVR